MSGDEQQTDIPDIPEVDGMGVSSERVGPVGSGEDGTDGVRDTSPAGLPEDTPPEQSPGGDEVRPEGVAPAAGYPSHDPRSAEKPYEA